MYLKKRCIANETSYSKTLKYRNLNQVLYIRYLLSSINAKSTWHRIKVSILYLYRNNPTSIVNFFN